ncbi:MAG: amidohydrolase family protein, partial [Alphaproteobacteria bacterium]
FRLHATYDETIDRALDVFEKINHDIPLEGLRWFFDHAETVSHRSLDRIKKLGGGIAIQHRMAFQGEYFVDRYGKEKASHSPPLRQMIERGIPVGAGTDATRVASYNPFICLYWLTTGKTVGGLPLYNEDNILTREEALRLWTQGSAYKSKEEDVKGILDVGQYADFAVLNKDYMTILDEEVKDLFSVMTVVGGKIVYGDDEFLPHNPSLPPVSPSWSPTGYSFAGFKGSEAARGPVTHSPVSHSSGKCSHGTLQALNGHSDKLSQWLGLGQNPQKRCFQNPWTLGCGCFVY